MAYITNTDIETFLNIDLTPNGESLANAIIAGIEATVDAYCNRSFSVDGEKTEKFDGGEYRYFVKHPPISSVSSVTIDGTAQTEGEDEDYVVYDDYVQLTTRAKWGLKIVEIVYTSAVSLPADVKHALVRWCAEVFNSATEGGKTAKRQRVGQVEVEYLTSQAGMPDYVKMVLDLHRKRPV